MNHMVRLRLMLFSLLAVAAAGMVACFGMSYSNTEERPDGIPPDAEESAASGSDASGESAASRPHALSGSLTAAAEKFDRTWWGVDSVALSTDGKWALTAGGDWGRIGGVRLWALDGKGGMDLKTTKSGFAACVRSIALSSDGKWVLTGDEDERGSGGSARLWALDGAGGIEERAAKYDSQRRVECVALSADGKWALTGGLHARLWALDGLGAMDLKATVAAEEAVLCVAFSADSKWAMTGGMGLSEGCIATLNGVLRLWSLDEKGGMTLRATKREHASDASAVAFSADGKWALSAGPDDWSSDASVRLWALDGNGGMEVRATKTEYTCAVGTVAFSADGNWALAAGYDVDNSDPRPGHNWVTGAVRLWALDGDGGMKLSAAKTEHTCQARSACFSADGKWVLSSGCDRKPRDELGESCASIRLWKME